jgi:hypothetical protein
MNTRLWYLPVILLAPLAVPSRVEAQAQVRSNIASIALTAYAAPGVHVAPGAGPREAGAGALDLTRMSVNTPYRIEIHGGGSQPVVLLRRSGAGQVPWEQIRALVETGGAGPRVLDLVVTPQL